MSLKTLVATIIFLTSFLVVVGIAQTSKLNLDFENISGKMPTNWYQLGREDYSITIDSNVSKSGKNSVLIEYQGNSPFFKALALNIPAKFGGKKIKLTGFIKTENVTDGHAGLLMRIDPGVGADNMQSRGIKGTTDWKKYEIELDLKPRQAKQIVIGGILVGKGKMWIDNLEVTIDGIPISKASPPKLLPADKDKEFDNGSKVSIDNLDKKLISDLEILGRVWGFLKYHHPSIAKGNYNWDYELFRILPKFTKEKISKNREQVISTWIDSLGKIKKCKTCKETSPAAILKPDLKWIDKTIKSIELRKKLNSIYSNRNQGSNYYIQMYPRIGNPIFNHEKSYENMPYPDEGFRLLALYRYWNMVYYFFPYKHLMDKNWNSVLKDYIPKFINAKNEYEYELATVKIIGDIQDSHATLRGANDTIQEKLGKYYPPFRVSFIENKLVITNFYHPKFQEKSGLQIGDIVTKINGVSVEKIVKKRLVLYPASNYATQLRNISFEILRNKSDKIQITYKRKEKKQNKELQLYELKDTMFRQWQVQNKNKKSFKMLDGNIGYITLNSIKFSDIPKIKQQFKNTKGIIIDIRNYPNTFVVFPLGSFFTSQPTEFVKFTQGNINNPGEFIKTPPLKVGSNNPDFYKGKVIVIVNEYTQSQAEYTAMAFRAGNNTTIIGSTTAGADGNVSRIDLPGGLQTAISGIGVLYPDGTETQRIGIIPDVKITPTIAGIKKGKDELLEKAKELINQ